jgi:hypothetical protein
VKTHEGYSNPFAACKDSVRDNLTLRQSINTLQDEEKYNQEFLKVYWHQSIILAIDPVQWGTIKV